MLDLDLAALYGVETKRMNEAVRRNLERFPDDFMFQLSREERDALASESVISQYKGRRSPPLAFTEQGVAMLSSVLRSERAVKVNVEIMRAFVRLRRMVSEHSELVARLDALEAKYDTQFAQVFQVIRQLMAPPLPDDKRTYGFTGAEEHGKSRQPKARATKSDPKPKQSE